MKSKITFFVLLVLFQVISVVAQERTVTGQVTTSEDGMTLPGANVIVKGTNRGTTTNMDGNYSITVSPDETLVFSSLGFGSKEVTVGNQSIINVALSEDAESLDEGVVASFGIERQKRALGYAVLEISSEDISRTKQQNVVSALQGQAAGVQITNSGASEV